MVPNTVRLSSLQTDKSYSMRKKTNKAEWIHLPENSNNEPNTHIAKKKLNESLADQIKEIEAAIKLKYRRREKLEKAVEEKRAIFVKEQINTERI